MTKTVLYVIGVGESDDDLALAIDFCDETRTHLSVLVAALAPPAPIGEYGLAASDVWAKERETDLAAINTCIERAKTAVARRGVSCDISSAYAEMGELGGSIAQRSLYSDLTLLTRQTTGAGTLRTIAYESTIFEARNPVLVLPAGGKATLSPKRVMVAWDSRAESSRAVHVGLDILRAAQDVRVALVDPRAESDENASEPGADVGAYLARHGVKVTVDRLPSAGRLVSDVLKQHAADISCDMIVMGAYGHSRLRERIFGGVTKSMIDNPPLPLFMAH